MSLLPPSDSTSSAHVHVALRRFVSEWGKIKGRGNTDTCRKHQTQIAVSVKRAREMALLSCVGASEEPQTRPRSRNVE